MLHSFFFSVKCLRYFKKSRRNVHAILKQKNGTFLTFLSFLSRLGLRQNLIRNLVRCDESSIVQYCIYCTLPYINTGRQISTFNDNSHYCTVRTVIKTKLAPQVYRVGETLTTTNQLWTQFMSGSPAPTTSVN